MLHIIDNGLRVNTPIQTRFNRRGVDGISQSKASHDSSGTERQVDSDGQEFSQLLEREAQFSQSQPAPSTEVLKQVRAASAYQTPKLTAAQLMSSPVHRIVEGTTFHIAYERMTALKVKHLMVEDSAGKITGILAMSDVLDNGKGSVQSITAFYSRTLLAASPETDVHQIAASFIEYDISAMPVFDANHELLGIITRTDLLRMIISGAHVERWV